MSSARMFLQPLAAPTTMLVDKVKNKAQDAERRNFVMDPQWTVRSQSISINLISMSEIKISIKIFSVPLLLCFGSFRGIKKTCKFIISI